jgi:interferon gamma-inducible protein 30
VEKVKVELYSEALCPYCAEFIVNYLNPFFNNGIIDIVELRIIPYGNAHVDSSGTMVCQVSSELFLWHSVDHWAPPLIVALFVA